MSAEVVRRLVNLIGFDVDRAGFERAEKGFAELKNRAASVEKQVAKSFRPRGSDGKVIQGGANRVATALGGVATAATRAGAATTKAMLPAGANGRQLASGVRHASAAARTAQGEWGGLGGAVRGVMGLFAAQWVARGMLQPLRLASDVRETINLLDVTFGESSTGIQQWANSNADALGRSKHLLNEYAGDFGAFLKSTMGEGDQLNGMSTALAERVVDLASFRNLDEDVALQKIRSGLAGETEPLRHIGIDVSVVAQKEFAKANGEVIESMDRAQRMALRYRLIMARTADSQGDAVKTSEEYANATKGLGQSVHDLVIELGEKMRPGALRFVIWARDASRGALRLAKNTNVLESAVKALTLVAGGAAAAKLLKWVAANKALVKVMGRSTLLFGVLLGLISEVNALFSGGKSIIGSYMDKVGGLGTADQFVRDHRQGVEDLNTSWEDTKEAAGEYFDDFAELLGESVDALDGSWTSAQTGMLRFAKTASEVFADVARNAVGLLDPVFQALEKIPGMGGLVSGARESINTGLEEAIAGVRHSLDTPVAVMQVMSDDWDAAKYSFGRALEAGKHAMSDGLDTAAYATGSMDSDGAPITRRRVLEEKEHFELLERGTSGYENAAPLPAGSPIFNTDAAAPKRDTESPLSPDYVPAHTTRERGEPFPGPMRAGFLPEEQRHRMAVPSVPYPQVEQAEKPSAPLLQQTAAKPPAPTVKLKVNVSAPKPAAIRPVARPAKSAPALQRTERPAKPASTPIVNVSAAKASKPSTSQVGTQGPAKPASAPIVNVSAAKPSKRAELATSQTRIRQPTKPASAVPRTERPVKSTSPTVNVNVPAAKPPGTAAKPRRPSPRRPTVPSVPAMPVVSRKKSAPVRPASPLANRVHAASIAPKVAVKVAREPQRAATVGRFYPPASHTTNRVEHHIHIAGDSFKVSASDDAAVLRKLQKTMREKEERTRRRIASGLQGGR